MFQLFLETMISHKLAVRILCMHYQETSVMIIV